MGAESWDMKTTLGRTADFLECLRFQVRLQEGVLIGNQRHRTGASVRYIIRSEDEQTIRDRRSGLYFKPFDLGNLGGLQTRRIILLSPELLAAGREYEAKRLEAERRGVSVMALSAGQTALRVRDLIEESDKMGIQVTSFRQFLRDFVDIDVLREKCLAGARLQADDRYVEPKLVITGREMSLKSFLAEFVLPRRGERLILIHAPGGRGKTSLCDHIARSLFHASGTPEIPIPFLIRFQDHRDITGFDALIHDALGDYGLDFDLSVLAMDRLIKYGTLILVFDGFDELSERAGDHLAKNVRELASKIHHNTTGRAILTCRETFLTSFPDLLKSVESEAEEAVLLVDLHQFDRDQVRDFLVLNAPGGVDDERHRDRVLTLLSHHPLLWELAQEPLTLGMISQIVAEMEHGLPDNLAGIYDRFIDVTCTREALRHELPPELEQRRFLASLAEDMLSLGQFSLERYWVEEKAREFLQAGRRGWDPDRARQLEVRLLDHYMFAPESLSAGANIRFRHMGYRDFLIAWSLRERLGEGPEFGDTFGSVELPEEVLGFIAELLNEGQRLKLSGFSAQLARAGTRNLCRLMAQWDGGRFFGDVFPPPGGLRGKPLDGMVFEGLDLRGYRWEGAGLDRVTFRDCDLTDCDLGLALWRDLRIERCTMLRADFGESLDRNIVIDGQAGVGAELRTALSAAGALGPGVRKLVPPSRANDIVSEILLEVFKKTIDGNRREAIRMRRVLPETFLRGRILGDTANHVFVKETVLKEVQGDWPMEGGSVGPFLISSGDRHGTLILARGRMPEVLDFVLNGRVSIGLTVLAKSLRAKLEG